MKDRRFPRGGRYEIRCGHRFSGDLVLFDPARAAGTLCVPLASDGDLLRNVHR